jgi:hypothetical protein
MLLDLETLRYMYKIIGQKRSTGWTSLIYKPIFDAVDPPTDGGGLTISGNLKSCEGPVLNCRGSTKRRALDLNELVIDEIQNNASAIFQNLFSAVLK